MMSPLPNSKNTLSLSSSGKRVCVLLLLMTAVLTAQTPQAANDQKSSVTQNQPSRLSGSPDQSSAQPSISLSPAVITAKGSNGQGLTQILSLNNNTSAEFVFEMEAQDVIVRDGKRVFVAAGEEPGSIAATAVFSQKQVVIKPHTVGTVEVRLTLPQQTKIRAMVAIFHGTNRIASSSSAVGMTASLGTLITFNLSDNVKLEPEALRVAPPSDTTNLTVAEWVSNVGTEPALPDGLAVILDAKGNLVARIPVASQRLLPGERLEFSGEYASQLQPGDYKAMCTLQFEGRTLTSEKSFKMQ